MNLNLFDQVKKVVRADGTVVLSLRGGWSEKAIAAIATETFDELSINSGDWGNFEPLHPYAEKIRRLNVSSPVDTYRGLETLTNLIDLELHDTPNPPLDLLQFKMLESCYLKWHKRYPKQFFTLPNLKDITLAYYSEKNCEDLGQSKTLKKIDLRQGSVESLRGLEGLRGLTHLSLAYMRNLNDVSAIGNFRELEALHIEKCPRVLNVDFVSDLPNLRKLFLDCGANGFVDLTWMTRLRKLVDVLVAIPVENVNWRIVFSLPMLQRVVINAHPGYEISDEEIRAMAKAQGRELADYARAGTRKHPAFKFTMVPVSVH
jgi:hypothetical protein